jgi:hypothetical protein
MVLQSGNVINEMIPGNETAVKRDHFCTIKFIYDC